MVMLEPALLEATATQAGNRPSPGVPEKFADNPPHGQNEFASAVRRDGRARQSPARRKILASQAGAHGVTRPTICGH